MNAGPEANAPPERTIRSARAFAATPARLWRFFEDPALLAAWWGPEGFTNAFEEFDFRAGGAWRFTMTGPDGAAYPMAKRFASVDPARRIAIEHPDATHGHVLVIDFEAAGDSTRLAWTMVFDHADEATRVRPFVEAANAQNLERLAGLLETETREERKPEERPTI